MSGGYEALSTEYAKEAYEIKNLFLRFKRIQ